MPSQFPFDNARESTAMVWRLVDGDEVARTKVASLVIGGRIPSCSSGAECIIPALGKPVTCTYHGDLLTKNGFYVDGKRIFERFHPDR